MSSKRPDCFQCRHFYITWNPTFPRGCRAYGIQSQQIPSIEVLQADGRECMQFQLKPRTIKNDSSHHKGN